MDDNGSLWNVLVTLIAAGPLTRRVMRENGPWSGERRGLAGGGERLALLATSGLYSLGLWWALPFFLWLGCGRLGLVLHWEALAGDRSAPGTVPTGSDIASNGLVPQVFSGDPPCSALQSETS